MKRRDSALATRHAEPNTRRSAGMTDAYDAQNHRIWSWAGATDSWSNPTGYTVYLHAPQGQRLAAYQMTVYSNNGLFSLWSQVQSSDRYFGSRRLAPQDRLGSAGDFYPWGEAKGSNNPQDTWSYATYWRDSASGLDYANNRYYSNQYARFMTPDPYEAAGGPSEPLSWNQYAYTRGDPVNRVDLTGMDDTPPPTFSTTVWAPGPLVEAISLPTSLLGGYFGSAITGAIQAARQRAPQPLMGINVEVKDAFNSLTNCASLFGGTAKVDSEAQDMVFWDGRRLGSMGLAGDTTNTQTFATYHAQHPSATATTLLNADGQASTSVVLWADFFPETQADQYVTLIHEFIHSIFDLTAPDHSDIVSKFKIKVNPGETNSAAIDRWIKDNCKN